MAGRPILPGAAMFEAALAAARALQPDEQLEAGSSSFALTAAAIPAPVLLGSGGAAGAMLRCAVNSSTGSIELSQTAGVWHLKIHTAERSAAAQLVHVSHAS